MRSISLSFGKYIRYLAVLIGWDSTYILLPNLYRSAGRMLDTDSDNIADRSVAADRLVELLEHCPRSDCQRHLLGDRHPTRHMTCLVVQSGLKLPHHLRHNGE